jgi:hypothetical protein
VIDSAITAPAVPSLSWCTGWPGSRSITSARSWPDAGTAAIATAHVRTHILFRDYSVPLEGISRFIPVRSDERRILTCFLEYEEDTVVVHDLLHERSGDIWNTRVSSYRKLRLSTDRVIASLETSGFEVRRQPGLRGMVRIVATIA